MLVRELTDIANHTEGKLWKFPTNFKVRQRIFRQYRFGLKRLRFGLVTLFASFRRLFLCEKVQLVRAVNSGREALRGRFVLKSIQFVLKREARP